MANTIITPTVIARRALATLYNSTVFAALVHRDYDADFTGKQGDTITVRKPATFTAAVFDRNTGIVPQDATEDSTPLELDTLLDVSFAVTAEELTLQIDDFAGRLVDPAMEAIVQKVDATIAEKLIDTAEGSGGGGTVTKGSTASTVFTGELGALAKLGRGKAPTANRSAVFSPEAAGVCLTDTLFVEADKSGATDGLREGSIGRVFGFDTYQSQALGYGAGDSGAADGVAFHKDAVAFVSRTLDKPIGIADSLSTVANYKGLGLRVVRDYDITKKQDVVSIDFLCGVAALREALAIQISMGLGS